MGSLEGQPINIIDIGVVLVLLISGVLAYARGLVHEILSIGGWIGAVLSTIFFYPVIKPLARQFIPIDLAADLSAGVVIFIVTLVILSFVTRALSSRVKESALNVLDRSLGFLFGLTRGALLVCVAYLGLEFLVPKSEQPEWITSAKTMPIIVEGAAALVLLMPDGTNLDLPKFDTNSATQDIIKLVAPTPSSGQTPPPDGYSDTERQDMERLIETSE
ncbi:MAG: CvpA family protein [Alphaproteobacteria bacterium]|nr:CvpA family protein [Alphaproteobacteria bacterium]